MTKLSRIKVAPEKMSLFLDDFWSAIALLESKEEAKQFFNEFLTHTEKKMFAKRFQILLMLLNGNDYIKIRERLKVSDATIAKINNWIQENREMLVRIGKRILELKFKKMQRLENPQKSGHIRGDLLSSVADELANSTIRVLARSKKRSSVSR